MKIKLILLYKFENFLINNELILIVKKLIKLKELIYKKFGPVNM
jgi:hypothetical protein